MTKYTKINKLTIYKCYHVICIVCQYLMMLHAENDMSILNATANKNRHK